MRTGEELLRERENQTGAEVKAPEMKKRVLVYISGPITPTDEMSTEQHVAQAVKVFIRLTGEGIPSICVHMGAAFPSAYDLHYHTWMAYDLAVLAFCTHILMLPGWEKSPGSVLERTFATGRGIPIFYKAEDLVETIWAREKE
jgi:hypothetical protein